MIGQSLGHYRIEAKLGEGGMGVVYKATDTTLGREVAIKVIPEGFARDPERLTRFEREARVLASLNHPHIAAIYGFEQAGGIPFLVLELVPGETLRGPLPLAEALPLAGQIAEALEAAHEKGIIHRDLKPANVKITPEGKVKVLDFGLAKAFTDEPSADPARSPTVSHLATKAGVLLGTAAYMSPEQARGKALDPRTDIWSFGCLLYEILTARQAFGGETLTDTLAAIVSREPDWSALPPATPQSVLTLLRRCLHKDPRRRLRDIGTARLELEEALSAAPPATSPAPSRRILFVGLACALAGAALAALAVWKLKPSPATPPPARLVVALPSTEPLAVGYVPALALSPDGSRLVYAGRSGSNTRLYLRPLAQFDAKPIPGTEGAAEASFSPDGEWIAFFADGKLKKVAVAGGALIPLCDAPNPVGVSWASDGTIFFTPDDWIGCIARVPAGGGKAEIVTCPDPARGESAHGWPHALPGGEAILFAAGKGPSFDSANIEVLTLKTGQRRTVIQGGNVPIYLPTGHLLYTRAGVVFAAPFNLAQLAVTGPSVPVLDGVMSGAGTGTAQFAVSRDGLMAYVPGGEVLAERSLVTVDRQGIARPLAGIRRPFEDLDVSPDGRRIAFTIEGPAWNVWIYELSRGTLTRLTFEGDNRDPLWTPDGKRIIYSSFREGRYSLFWKPADGSGPEERLTTGEHYVGANSWTPDGRLLAFVQPSPETSGDLWLLPIEGDRKPRPLLNTRFGEEFAAFSPDGRWLAYATNESGREEVYVQPFPGPGGRVQISTEGGSRPVWARDGRELFYRFHDKLFAVAIRTTPEFTPGSPRLLFQGRYWEAGRDYGLLPPGDRFVFIQEAELSAAPTQIRIVQNWFLDLQRRLQPRAP